MDSSFDMSKAISILVAAIVFFGLPRAALGQAWTQDKGNAYLKIAHGRTSVSDQYDLDGNSIPFIASIDGDAFFDRSVYLYGEFGVLNGFTLVGMIPIKNVAVLNSDGEEQNSRITALPYEGFNFDHYEITPAPPSQLIEADHSNRSMAPAAIQFLLEV